MISAAALRGLPLFREASDAALASLASAMSEKRVPAGGVILREGEESGALHLIASGSVTVHKQLDDRGERSKVVARLGAEEFFGEMSFLENKPISATVAAETDAHLYILARASLNELIRRDPSTALEQVLTLLSGVSSRLRHTTQELVAVFEIARVVGLAAGPEELADGVLGQLKLGLGSGFSVAFYRWNPFNDEYALVRSTGAAAFPAVVDGTAEVVFPTGRTFMSRADFPQQREGLFVYHDAAPGDLTSAERQLIETVSAVVAPALVGIRAREEEDARRQFERRRQEGYPL